MEREHWKEQLERKNFKKLEITLAEGKFYLILSQAILSVKLVLMILILIILVIIMIKNIIMIMIHIVMIIIGSLVGLMKSEGVGRK